MRKVGGKSLAIDIQRLLQSGDAKEQKLALRMAKSDLNEGNQDGLLEYSEACHLSQRDQSAFLKLLGTERPCVVSIEGRAREKTTATKPETAADRARDKE